MVIEFPKETLCDVCDHLEVCCKREYMQKMVVLIKETCRDPMLDSDRFKGFKVDFSCIYFDNRKRRSQV